MRMRSSHKGRQSDHQIKLPELGNFVAELNSNALIKNYYALRELVPGQGILPMVKANAYGHGSVWVSRQLLELPALYAFGVATLEEGIFLRRELGPRGRRAKIIVFSGATPWSEEKGQLCERYHLTPVIASDEDWVSFAKDQWFERISYELKFNTGMNRLGMSLSQARGVARALRTRPSIAHPSGIFSHFAMAETPTCRLSQFQVERFIALKRELASVFPSAHFHMANSAAIWNQKHFGLQDLTDVVRPGISLYGVTPWAGAPVRGITPVLRLKARVIAIRTLKEGESVGYGARYRVSSGKGFSSVRLAVLGAGYADGVHRLLSGEGVHGGWAWIGGHVSKILGTISMDLSTVQCPQSTRVGDWAVLFGPEIDAWEQAGIAGTIPYELLTSVSTRVQRVYV